MKYHFFTAALLASALSIHTASAATFTINPTNGVSFLTISAVPEPTSALLLGAGGLAVGARRRRR